MVVVIGGMVVVIGGMAVGTVDMVAVGTVVMEETGDIVVVTRAAVVAAVDTIETGKNVVLSPKEAPFHFFVKRYYFKTF